MSPIAARFWVARWFRAPRQDLAASVKLCSLVTCCDCCVMCHPCPCCVSHSQHRSRDCPIASARLPRRPQNAIRRFQHPPRPCAASGCKWPTTPTPTMTIPCCNLLRQGAFQHLSWLAAGCAQSRVPGILLFSRSISILTEFSISSPLDKRSIRHSDGVLRTLCVAGALFLSRLHHLGMSGTRSGCRAVSLSLSI